MAAAGGATATVVSAADLKFAAAVDELASQLYGDETPPVPLREVFAFLVSDGRIEKVPAADELPAVIAGLSGIPVRDVDSAHVDRVLRNLALELGQRSQAGTARSGLRGGRSTLALPRPAKLASRTGRPGLAEPAALAVPALPGLIALEAGKDRSDAGRAAGLGEFDAAAFDRAWGKLPGHPVRGDAVGRAVALARELIGRQEPVIGVRTPMPIAELDPLGQAVRWLALQIYRNPGDQAGTQALATALAARLDVVLLMARPSTDDHLLAEVNLLLRQWQKSSVGIEDVRRALVESPPIRTDLRGRANDVAEYLVRGAVTRVRGGGSGVEAEFPYLVSFSGEHDLDEILTGRAVLAYGPGRTFAVTVDDNVCFEGGDGRYYRTKADAESAAYGTVSVAKLAMPEFVSNVMRTSPSESGYADHEPVFMALARLEEILANLPGEAGSLPGTPLSEVLPEDGFELTELGLRALIGPGPVGDWPAAEVQHTFGVPLTGLYVLLEHVLDHMRPDENGYLTRTHLEDALEFGNRIAFRFMMERYFPDGNLPPGFSPADELVWRSASEPAVAQLRGYAALLYIGAATVAHSLIYKGLNKDNAAVLARHDMAQILAALEPEGRDYLKRKASNIMNRFELSFRDRIPDYDDQFRKRWFDQEAGGGPATINLLTPPMDWARAHEFGLPISPANYLLGGLDPAAAPEIPQYLYMGMSTLPGLDTNHQEELGLELVVLEVRSYGAWHVSAEEAQAQHERLAAVVRELGVRDQQMALAASVRQVIRESLEEHSGILNLTLAGPLVTGHARPGVIWRAALDFLRTEPAITSQVRFVEDAWRDFGQRWNLIPLPAGIRQLLGVGGPTVIAGSHAAGRRTHVGSGQDPEPVAVTFPEGRSGEADIPDSLELTALARWLAEAGAAHGASATPHGGQLPQVRITGFGNESSLDPADESARRTGQQRADAVRARLLSSVRDYLRQLGADPAIADSLLPAAQAFGASGQNLAPSEAAGQAVVTVIAPSRARAIAEAVESTPSGFYLRADGAGGVADGPQDRVAARAFPKVSGAVVVHVHTDPASGLLAVGGQLLTPEEFRADVMPLLRLEPGQLLVLVACRIGAVQPGAQAAAGALADLAERPVLAASGDVFTTPSGAVEVRQAVVDPTGHMTLDAQGAAWRLFQPGQAEAAEFGTDLFQVLRSPALADALLGQLPPKVLRRAAGTELPTDDVKWLAQADAFADLPPDAVAVNGDGTYMTVPDGTGALDGVLNLRFFTRSGRSLGVFEVIGVSDRGEEASVVGMYNFSQVRRVSPLVIWYLAAHTSATRLTGDTVVNLKLTAVLEKLGMTWSGEDMTGASQTVVQNAAAMAEQAGWILRLPEQEVPGASEPGESGATGEVAALAAAVFGDGRAGPEQLANLRLLADAVHEWSTGTREVTVADLAVEFWSLRGWPHGTEVSADDLRELVSLTGQARALRPADQPMDRADLRLAASQRLAGVFARLPENAVAARADGTYMTVPSGIGVIAGMDSPRFFDADGHSIGDVLLTGVRQEADPDGIDEVSFDEIRERASVPGIASLALWYLAAHTPSALELTINSAADEPLKSILGSLGMTQADAARTQMTGDIWTIAPAARAAAERAGWILRDPRLLPARATGFHIASVRPARKIVWPGGMDAARARPPDSLEQAWAVGHGAVTELAERLAEQSPDGDVEATSEALARYARAWLDHAAAVAALEEFRDRLDGSSNPQSAEQRLEAAVRQAKDELTQAHDELAALEIDPGRAWQELAALLARPVGGGLPAGGRGRSGDLGSSDNGLGDGARNAGPLGWRDAVLDLATGNVTYNRGTVTLPPSQAAVLAALIRADGELLTPGQLAEVTSYDANSIPSAVSRLRDELGRLPGFRGEITPARQDGGYRLLLSAALAAGQPAPWEGALLDLATGELRYEGGVLTLPPEQAALLAALIGTGGQVVTPGQLITGADQTQNGIRAAAAALSEALGQLPGFSGRLVTRDFGFRLASVVAWNGLFLEPTSGELRFGDSIETLPADQVAVLAALIGADGELRNSGQLCAGTNRAARTVRGVVSRLREVLGSLPGFRGEVTLQDGQAGGYRLLLSAALAAGQPPPWEGAVLDLATGELRYEDSALTLPPEQAAVLAALIGAGGQTVTPGQLITSPEQSQNGIRAAAAALSEALGQLPGFSGRLVTRGLGFRLASVAAWNGLSLDPATRVLRYGDSTETMLPDEVAVLAALIGADGQPRTPGQLATAAQLAASTVRGAVPGVREVLANLPGFRGEITPAQGPGGGYRLVLSAALAAGQEAGGPPPWRDALLDEATRELRYGGSAVTLLPDEVAVLAALVGADGQMVTPGQLINDPAQTQNDIYAAAARLSEAFEQLPGFAGRLATQGIGFMLVAVVVWNGLSLDPTTRVLRYRRSTETMLPDQAAVLAALIDADGQLRNIGQLARITHRSETNMYAAVSRLREVLKSLPGFGGKITNKQGPAGGYQLVLSTAPAAGPDAREPLASLAGARERLVRIPEDGFCLANALLTVAGGRGGPLAAAGITTPEQLHEELASYLEQLQDWGDLEDEARDAWAWARAGVGSGPLYSQFYALAGTPGAREEMRAQLVGELRQAGAWNTAGFDLALAVAARRFRLAVTIVYADGRRHQLTDGDFQVTLYRRSAIHWDAAVPDGTPQPGETSRRPASPGSPGPNRESARKRQRTDPGPAEPAAGVVALPAGAAVLAAGRVPVFEIAERVDVVDQALRWIVGHAEGAADTPLRDGEDLRITEWRLREHQLRYDPRIDQQFPWRDPADPLNRVYHPFADPDTGALDPGWTVTTVETTAPRALQAMASGADTRLGRVSWTEVRSALPTDVGRLVQAMISGPAQQPRVIARVLTANDVLDHERPLIDQHGVYLTQDALTATGDERPLLRNGRVLGLYAGAVLDTPDARQQWNEVHGPAGTHTIDVPTRSGLRVVPTGSEGYAGAVSFANTRLQSGPLRHGRHEVDESFATGVNAEFMAFHVRLRHRDGRVRWQPIMALVGLDNLYGDHNPAGMVIVNYGSAFHIKTEPETS